MVLFFPVFLTILSSILIYIIGKHKFDIFVKKLTNRFFEIILNLWIISKIYYKLFEISFINVDINMLRYTELDNLYIDLNTII